MKDITLLTAILISIPESFLMFLTGALLINISFNFKTLLKMSLLQGIITYILFNYFNLKFGIHTVVLSFISMFLFKFYTKSNLKNSFIAIFLGTTIIFCFQTITLLFLGNLENIFPYLLSNEYKNIFYFYPSFLFSILFVYIIYKKKIKLINNKSTYKSNKLYNINKNELLIILILLSLFFILVSFSSGIDTSNYKLQNLHDIIKVIILILFVVFIIYITFYIRKIYEDNIKKELDNNLMIKTIYNMENTVYIINKQKQNYFKQLKVIYSLLRMNKLEHSKEYIKSLIDNIDIDLNIHTTGNIYLDALINLKREECRENYIKFDLDIKNTLEDIQIPYYELLDLIIIIIDSSIIDLNQSNIDEKYIKLYIYEDNFNYIINIKNNSIERINTKYISLEKYNFRVYIEDNQQETILTILIPKEK